jgi:hypothetical protein
MTEAVAANRHALTKQHMFNSDVGSREGARVARACLQNLDAGTLVAWHEEI